MSDEVARPAPHGKVVARDFSGYSIYVCADCGQNYNSPGCSAKRSTQTIPPTFMSLLNDPTQQLDPEGVVFASVREVEPFLTPPGWVRADVIALPKDGAPQ